MNQDSMERTSVSVAEKPIDESTMKQPLIESSKPCDPSTGSLLDPKPDESSMNSSSLLDLGLALVEGSDQPVDHNDDDDAPVFDTTFNTFTPELANEKEDRKQREDDECKKPNGGKWRSKPDEVFSVKNTGYNSWDIPWYTRPSKLGPWINGSRDCCDAGRGLNFGVCQCNEEESVERCANQVFLFDGAAPRLFAPKLDEQCKQNRNDDFSRSNVGDLSGTFGNSSTRLE